MREKITMILLLLVSASRGLTQDKLDIVRYYEMDTMPLFIEINRKMMEYGYDSSFDINIYPIYLLVDKNHRTRTKEDYVNLGFLDSLKPTTAAMYRTSIVNHKRHWFSRRNSSEGKLSSDTTRYLVMEQILVGTSQSLFVGWVHPYSLFLYMAKPMSYAPVYDSQYSPLIGLYNSHTIDFLLRIYDDSIVKTNKCHYYWGIDCHAHKVYCVLSTRYGAELFPLEEIVNDHWEDFQNGLPLLYDEVRKRKQAEYETTQDRYE